MARGDRDERDDHGKTSKRTQRMEVVRTRPHDESKIGNHPNQLNLCANFFKLVRSPNWKITKYHVTFDPEVVSAPMRKAMVYQHKPQFGGYLFDGTQLFLIRSLPATETVLISKSREGVEYKLTVRFTKEVAPEDMEFSQILNLILRRAMDGLKLKLINRNFYDPAESEKLRDFPIQLWPGYDTSIRQHEYDILVNADVATKVMRTDTVYNLLEESKRAGNSFKETFQQKVLGITVLTDYNNETYRIDDVDFEKTPLSTFKKGEEDVSFVNYYRQVC